MTHRATLQSMEATEMWEIEGEIAAKAYEAFRDAWMKAAKPKRVETGEEIEMCQRTFAVRWSSYRENGV